MNVVVIPFFLAAHLTVDKSWEHGPEYVFHVQVNSTAIPDEGIYGSVRLNLESKLVCQPKDINSLSCHFKDSKANSFVSDSLDPSILAVPDGPVNRQEAYEVNEDQFEIKFNEKGLDSLLVDENIQPTELDMIRVIVGQLNIGTTFDDKNEESFNVMENFTQGECATNFKIDKKMVRHLPHTKQGYTLKSVFGLKDGKLVQIWKIRNLHMCTHKIPYYFGSSKGFKEVSDITSDVNLSDSRIIITSTEFVSGTSNVITTSKIIESLESITTFYENIQLRLHTIQPAQNAPPMVREAETASIFIGRWLIDDTSDDTN